MAVQRKASVLNRLAQVSFPVRPQYLFQATTTVSYEENSRISRLAGKISELWKKGEFTDEEVERFTANSMIGLMAARLDMEEKAHLCNLLVKWLLMHEVKEEVAACILQSLFALRTSHNDIYAIRMAIWNFTTKSDVKSKTILQILPSGKLRLSPRNEGRDAAEEFVDLAHERLKLTKEVQLVKFRAMEQYDFTAPTGAIEPVLERPAPLGYKVGKRSNCFGNFSWEQIEENKKMKWGKKKQSIDYLSDDKELDLVDQIEKEEKENEEEEERYFHLKYAQRYNFGHGFTLSGITSGDSSDSPKSECSSEFLAFNAEHRAVRVRQ